jgi:NADPH-dependent ferric siderophore reductase
MCPLTRTVNRMANTTRRPVSSLVDRFLLPGTVDQVEDLTPRIRRIRIVGKPLGDLNYQEGQHVRVQVGALGEPRAWLAGFRDLMRTYSVWHYDHRGVIELCIFDHPGDGPGARWSRQARVGQRVALLRPEGRLVLSDSASYHLFVGDVTASVAFGAMLRTLDISAVAFSVIEAGADDRLSFTRSDETLWVEPGADQLLSAVRALDIPVEPGVAYVAGHAGRCQAIRRHLMNERGWPRRAVRIKPFWAPGKRGLD